MIELDDLALVGQALFETVSDDWVAGHPYGPAFFDIFGTLHREMPEAVYLRYIRSWQEWFENALLENEFRKARQIPSLETYLDFRLLSVGLLPCIVSAEYFLDQDLTELVAADAQLARAGRVAVEHAMLVNDLYSFRQECFRGDNFNCVSVLVSTMSS
ncbi:terpene synthase family protein [Streptomyces spectabilis]|uniref:Terpene synthase n=1 Tax=Streptomyces spectabilis TaxID=68270 RepID=A0A7W8F0T0_STRST|nr:terpene synthase family protein [Streptomyces spectabilis]MBB5110080.1 hypothetical protein [Streptomyces spectabilis]